MRWRRHGLVWPPTVLLLSVWAMLGLGACGDDDPVADASGADTTVDQTLDTMPDGPAIPVPTDAPIKGPWVLQVDTDSALIRWQSELMPETAAIEYGPVDGTERQTATGSSVATEVTVGWDERGTFTTPDPVGTFYLTDVQIEGLAPATCYEWSVVGHQENLGRFCTMHEATDHDTPISIFVVGDTSPGLTLTQVLVDQFMVEEPEFTVHVGDLQYYSVIIETWQLWFDTMQPLLSAGAMFPCIGNHEDELEPEGVEFDEYYKRFWGMAGDEGDAYAYHFETGGVHFFALNSEDDIGPMDEGVTWLAERLVEVEQEPGYRFTVLFFHHPIYTLARHGPKQNLREMLLPIIARHDIPLVLQGHNHVYERFVADDVTYVTTGGGGSGLYNLDENVENFPEDAPLRVAAARAFHAMMLEIDSTTIRGRAADDSGQEIDAFQITY